MQLFSNKLRAQYLVTTILFFVLLLTSTKVWSQVSGYNYSKQVRINSSQVAGSNTLNNFPVLFKKTANEFKSVANGGLIEYPGGNLDAVFTSDDGSTVYNYELESYDPTTGEIVAWVNVPSVDPNADTFFRVYFGNANVNSDQSNPAGTWDNNYQLVQHLENNFLDASGNNNNGTNNGTNDIAGQILRSRNFDGSNDYIETPNDQSLNITDQLTISMWVYVDDYSNVPDLVTKGAYDEAYSTWIRGSGRLRFNTVTGLGFFGNNNMLTSNSAINTGTWTYITFTKSSSGRAIYINGVSDATDNFTDTFNSANNALTVSSTSYPFDGRIDEVRISDTGRSANWVATEYNNQSDPAAFIDLINTPPILSNIESTAQRFKTGGAPVRVTSNLTVNDINGDNITSATITISSNYNAAQDELLFTDQNGITHSWNNSTGELTLTGLANVSDYQSALRSVQYINTSSSPTTANRTISFTVNDPQDPSNIATRDVSIFPPNIPPVLSNIESTTLSYSEDDGPIAITSSIAISDSDDITVDSANVIISGNYVQGEDELAFSNTASIISSWNPATGTLTLTGTASISDYETALRSVTYENTVTSLPSTIQRTISFSVHDGDDPSNTQSRDVAVSGVNDPPALTNIESTPLQVSGDDAPTVITSSITVSDDDSQNMSGATVQISNNYVSSEDVLGYNNILGISGSWNNTTGTLTLSGSATKSNYETALRSITYDNTSSTPSSQTRTVRFTISDGTGDSAPITRDIALSAVQAMQGLQLWLKGDAGVITNGSNEVTAWEDQSGNDRDFISGNTGNNPVFTTNISSLNNQAAVTFDGSGDFMLDDDGENYINGTTEFTAFYVIQNQESTSTNKGFFIAEDPVGEDKTFTIRYDEAGANANASDLIKAGILNNDPTNQLESFSDIQTTDGQILSLDWKSGEQFNLVVDGVLNNPSGISSPPVGTISNSSKVIVGQGGKDTGSSSWNGHIAEVIFFDRFLSLEERQAIEDYLSEKYNINIRLIGKAKGGKNISADTFAGGNTAEAGDYTTLTGPRLREDFRGELKAGETIVFEAPEGFEWDDTSSPSVTIQPAYGNSTNLSISQTNVTKDQITFTVDQESDATGKPGEAIFSGLRIRPTQGTLPNSGTITNTGTTGPGGTTNYGDIIMVPGATASLEYKQQPSTTPANQVISPAVEVQLTDQFGNDVKQDGITVTIAKASGTGTLTGTTNRNTNINGRVYFDNLKFDQTGSKKLAVTTSGLPSVESDAFSITDPGDLAGFNIEKLTGGNIPPQRAGIPFDIKITALDGTGSVKTDFNGKVEITSNGTLTQGAGATANFSNGVLGSLTIKIIDTGNFTLTATNADGPESGSSNSFTVSPGPADPATSTISANPTYIANDGSSTSTITVQLKDSEGNDLQSGGVNITLSTNEGSLSAVTDNNDGTYTATLTSSTSSTVASINGTLDGETIQNNAQVTFTQFDVIWDGTLGGDPPAEQWSNGNNWNTGNVPQPGDAVLIPADPAVGNRYPVVQQNDQTIQTLVIEEGADVTVPSGRTLTVNGAVTGNGEINGSNTSILQVGGDLTVAQLQIGNVEMNGSGSMQRIENNQQFENLKIDNPNNVLVNQNIYVNGTLDLSSGNLIIPSGKNLIADNQTENGGALTFQREISGVKGWRMISSPVESNYGDLLDGTLTQGYSGAFYDADIAPNDSLQPNVLWYQEDYQGTDNQRWRAPSSALQNLTAGRGLFVYVFGDIKNDDRYNKELPDTLEVTGPENTGNGNEVNFNVTYTDIADSVQVPDTGWNLVGNPYGATLNWDDNATWTKTNINQTIYVWDPNANGGQGNFLTWNGDVGSLGSGLLAPFQGFWIKANGPNPELKVSKENKTIDGVFRRKESDNSYIPKIKLTLETKEVRGMQQDAYVMFSDNAERDFDEKDGFRMFPFGENLLELYFVNENEAQMSIENLPEDFEYRYELPLEVGGIIGGEPFDGPFTLSWPVIESLPSDWIIKLQDNKLDKEINLRNNSFYSFDEETSEAKAKTYKSVNAKPGSPIVLSDPAITSNSTRGKTAQKSSNLYDTRFTLVITKEEIEQNIPTEFQLKQNYPNPFNPSTKIEFGLPKKSRVSIEIYNILGQLVRRLSENEIYPAGTHTITWQPNGLASGVYLYRIRTEEKAITKKMTFIK